MNKSKTLIGAACALALTVACAVIVTPTPPQTTVEAENHLTAMSVDVGGVTTNVDGIDLQNVVIGDVSYSSIPYGSTSSVKVTGRAGDVSVTIGTAVVYTRVLGQSVPVSFANINPMTTTITSGTLNTVVFDQTTAGVIFQALAKKRTPTVP